MIGIVYSATYCRRNTFNRAINCSNKRIYNATNCNNKPSTKNHQAQPRDTTRYITGINGQPLVHHQYV